MFESWQRTSGDEYSNCKAIILGGIGGFWLIIAFGGFDDQAVADGLGGDLYSHYLAVHDGADLLDIGLEFAFTDAGDLTADAAEILGLAPPGNAAAGSSSFACKIALS